MGRGGSWFTRFFFCPFVGDQSQTSLGQASNDATYDVYSYKAVKSSSAKISTKLGNSQKIEFLQTRPE